jgi:hypothetical protein
MKILFAILSCSLILGCSNPTNTSTGNLSNFSNDTGDGKTYYTVTFMNGNSVYETQTIESGQKATKPAVDPTYNDYEFQGWAYQNIIPKNINQIVVERDTVFKAAYHYDTYEITEGTFVSNHGDYYFSDNTLFSTIYYNNQRPKLSDDLMEDLIKKLKYFSTEKIYVTEYYSQEIKNYNTYTYSTSNINKKINEVRNEPDSEIETIYGSYTILFNHEGNPLTQSELYDFNIPLADYTWIAVKKINSRTTNSPE